MNKENHTEKFNKKWFLEGEQLPSNNEEKEQAEFLNSENWRMINYHSCQRSDVTLKGTVSENKLSTARLVLEDNLQITNKAQLEWQYN